MCGGVVRVVVCQLHSGREHLIWTAAADRVTSFGVVCGVVVVCRECSHLLIDAPLGCWFLLIIGTWSVWLSFQGRMVDALATGAEEGRGNLR